MADFQVHAGGAASRGEIVSVELRRDQLEWLTTAAESEMARHGRSMSKDPVYHGNVIHHLVGAYERLRAVT